MSPALTDKQIEWLLSQPAAKQKQVLDSLSKPEMVALKAAIGVYLKKKERSSGSSTPSPSPSPEQPEQKGSKRKRTRPNAAHPAVAVLGELLTIGGLAGESINRAGNIFGRPTDFIPRDLLGIDYRLAEILRDFGYVGYSKKKE